MLLLDALVLTMLNAALVQSLRRADQVSAPGSLAPDPPGDSTA